MIEKRGENILSYLEAESWVWKRYEKRARDAFFLVFKNNHSDIIDYYFGVITYQFPMSIISYCKNHNYQFIVAIFLFVSIVSISLLPVQFSRELVETSLLITGITVPFVIVSFLFYPMMGIVRGGANILAMTLVALLFVGLCGWLGGLLIKSLRSPTDA